VPELAANNCAVSVQISIGEESRVGKEPNLNFSRKQSSRLARLVDSLVLCNADLMDKLGDCRWNVSG
jgi:hypothetical protein